MIKREFKKINKQRKTWQMELKRLKKPSCLSPNESTTERESS